LKIEGKCGETLTSEDGKLYQDNLKRLFDTEEFEAIETLVIQLFGLVGGHLGGATEALLANDATIAHDLIARDSMVDELYHKIQRFAYEVLLTHVPGEASMRYLISILRIIPELERSGDLAEHIAARALRGITPELTPRIRGIIAQMGQIGVKMWRLTADDFADHRTTHLDTVESLDDELDDLQVALIAELASGAVSIPVTIELALIARFYERFGDHAVNLGRVLSGLWGRE
jgi:phosphate transport system protein